MAARALVAFTLFELEDKHLVALVLLHDLRDHLDARKLLRVADGLLAVADEQDLQVELVAFGSLELLDVEHVAGLDGVLLATGFHNRVHLRLPFQFK